MSRKKSLTHEQCIQIDDLYFFGTNAMQISKRLGISYCVVRRHLLKHNFISANYQIIPRNKRERREPPSKEMIDMFEYLLKAGYTYAEITSTTGYYYATIKYYTDPEYMKNCQNRNKDLYKRYKDRYPEYTKRAYEKRKAICQEAKEAARKNQVVE